MKSTSGKSPGGKRGNTRRTWLKRERREEREREREREKEEGKVKSPWTWSRRPSVEKSLLAGAAAKRLVRFRNRYTLSSHQSCQSGWVQQSFLFFPFFDLLVSYQKVRVLTNTKWKTTTNRSFSWRCSRARCSRPPFRWPATVSHPSSRMMLQFCSQKPGRTRRSLQRQP